MKKNKKRALELLQQRESDPKITCQWIGDETGYSRKQIERFAMELKEKDMQSILVHGNTGKKPVTTASDQEISYLEQLKKTYPTITIAQFRDIYQEDILQNPAMQDDVQKYGLKDRSKSWFRNMFVKEHWKSPAEKSVRMDGSRVTHPIRNPRDHRGELEQIDGTSYDWFNDGRSYVLHLAVDDADSSVLAGWFMPSECTRGYARMTDLILNKYGIPEAFYSDKDSVFRSVKSGTPSQYANMIHKAGIKKIFANTPQAKGRIERYNGTAQLRLPNDIIRWHIPHDYDYLNRWFNETYIRYLNAKFSFRPKDPHEVFRPLPSDYNRSKVFRAVYPRQVRNNMFSMGNALYSAFDENGVLLEFNQKTAVNVYVDVFTEEIYLERYDKHYTCMKVGQRKRDDIYEANTQKQLAQILTEIHEQNR